VNFTVQTLEKNKKGTSRHKARNLGAIEFQALAHSLYYKSFLTSALVVNLHIEYYIQAFR